MRKVYILVCVVLALVLGTLPAAAQETTFGLDAEDFTAFVNANDDSLEQTQYSFDYAVDFNLAGTNVPAVTVALTGSGALDIINEQISLSVDGTADFAGQSTPLSAELLLIGETLYAQAVDPASGESTGWFSFDAEELSNNADTGAVQDFVLENFAQGAEVDTADFDQQALFSAFASLASVDPESFISISRDEDTFTTTLSAPDLLRNPNFADALVQLLVASAIEPEANDELLTGATLVTDELAAALEGSTFSLVQQIDPDTQLVQQSTLTLDASLDLAAIEAGEGTVDFSFVTDVSLSDYGQPAELAAPEGVTPIPSSLILDAFGVAAAEESPPEALPTVPSLDPTPTVDSSLNPSDNPDAIAVDESVVVVVPADGVAQLTLETDETVTVTTRALDGADTTLSILDASGEEIAFNDDNGGGFPNLGSLDSAIPRLEIPGTVTIEVGEFSGDGGQVEVSVVAEEPIDNPDTVTVGETVTVTIPVGGSVSLALETDETVTITAQGEIGTDTILSVIGPDGNELASNDDNDGSFPNLGSLDSAVSGVTIPGSATIEVSEFGNDGGTADVTVTTGGSASVAPADAQAVELTCSTAPQEFEGDVGTVFTGSCPSGCGDSSVWGTDDYTDDSGVCTAAIHAGVVGTGGGSVTFSITPGQDEYTGSTQNGITTSDWGSWERSFSFGTTSEVETAFTCATTGQDIAGDPGTNVTATCSAGCGDSSVWGTNTYTDDSGVCTAAIHAGAISTEGGTVTVNIAEGQDEYTGSTQNGITSSDWGSWGRSFSFGG